MRTATERAAHQAEAELIAEAMTATSDAAWVVGKCASIWCQQYARGRTDEDFGGMLGLSRDQVSSRRRVWDRFGESRHDRCNLDWSHYYAALTWSDATECLDWAEDNQATVAEMKCWRRLQHGDEILFDDVSPEPTSSGLESADQSALSTPQDVADVAAKPSQSRARDVTPETELSHTLTPAMSRSSDREVPSETVATLNDVAAETAYSPFRPGAASAPAKPHDDNGDGASRDAVLIRKTCNAVTLAVKKCDDSAGFVAELLGACWREAPGDTAAAVKAFSSDKPLCR